MSLYLTGTTSNFPASADNLTRKTNGTATVNQIKSGDINQVGDCLYNLETYILNTPIFGVNNPTATAITNDNYNLGSPIFVSVLNVTGNVATMVVPSVPPQPVTGNYYAIFLSDTYVHTTNLDTMQLVNIVTGGLSFTNWGAEGNLYMDNNPYTKIINAVGWGYGTDINGYRVPLRVSCGECYVNPDTGYYLTFIAYPILTVKFYPSDIIAGSTYNGLDMYPNPTSNIPLSNQTFYIKITYIHDTCQNLTVNV